MLYDYFSYVFLEISLHVKTPIKYLIGLYLIVITLDSSEEVFQLF